MTTCANLLALMALELIRWSGRGGSGFVFLMFGLAIVGIVAWALARPAGTSAKD
jgi:hypothetical protein